MLKKIRVTLGVVFFAAITLMFLDFTGTLHLWFGWLAKIQFLPAVLALNFVTVAALLVVTLLFGRIYCSVICPLGVFQDGVFHLSIGRKKKKQTYSKEKKWLRYGVLALFIAALIAGIGSIVALIAPYSAWGRICQSIFAPAVQWVNNLLAASAEKKGSYAFVTKDIWLRSLPTLIVASTTLIAVIILAWRNGRTWCNTICPVGTVLSFFSRFAMFRPMIDSSKCKGCRTCERKCKASCIDIDGMTIDYSRCVDCFDCIENCRLGALKYRFAWGQNSGKKATDTPEENADIPAGESADKGRRAFLIGSAVALTGASLHAQEDPQDDKKRDGGLADVLPKVAPERTVPVTPFGSKSVKQFYSRCTACQLCVSACPNDVLRPSRDLRRLMQVEMSYEKGYCRPECVKCSEVCPAGAIMKITPEEKTSWKVGTATVNLDICLADSKGISCGNCARHCPVGAIQMVKKNPEDDHSPMIPAVVEEMCIGCGACENLCPVRPISAITVNGCEVHHNN